MANKQDLRNKKIPKPEKHSPRYLLHRYWGRKPSNIIKYFIETNTKENDLVLDPFMGSGITVIESNSINRQSIGIDINPLSKFIAKNTLTKINISKSKKLVSEVLEIPKDVKDLYKTNHKNNLYTIKTCVWDKNKLKRIKYYDPNNKKYVIKSSSLDDELALKNAEILLKKYNVSFPKSEIFKFVRRSGVNTIDKLFTTRNLLTMSLIKQNILKIKSKKERDFFLLIMSSVLPAATCMIPGDYEKVSGKSGWVISKFWKPSIHIEQNPIELFYKKAVKSIKAKEEYDYLINPAKFKMYARSSEKIKFIHNESVDLILTDPPYGDSIAYLGISMLWNEWLDNKVNYSEEIIIDASRKKNIDEYEIRLNNVFKECYRVLKKNKKLIFTFHNRHLKYWRAVMESCLNAQFILDSVVWIDQATSSGTQGINRKNTLKGDFVYTFVKSKKKNMLTKSFSNSKELIITKMQDLIKKDNYLTAAKAYEGLIPYIVNNKYYYEEKKIIDLEVLLTENFKYQKIKKNNRDLYVWR